MLVALLLICAVMTWLQPDAFASADNLYNITRNFAFIGIMALGMTAVILTGGIDLSVGSVMGVVGVVCGLVLQAEQHWSWRSSPGLRVGAICGAINGSLIAYARLPPFVVTLGMLSVARSLAIVFSQNKMIYEFGPYGDTFNPIGGGEILGIANSGLDAGAADRGLWLRVQLHQLGPLSLRHRRQRERGPDDRRAGRADQAAGLHLCSLTAAIAAVMIVGWQGSAINALGQGYELRVIASTVIGGANLMGGEGGAFGAFIGAALIEVIRNSLLMAGVDSNWQGTFVGVFIILAVLL